MLISSYFLCVLFIGANCGNSPISKTKFCVEHRIEGGRLNQTVLKIVMNITERECLTQCVRDKRCGAYNIWHENGTCELLPGNDKCGETDKQKDWTFVRLRNCARGVPWTTMRLDWVAETPCMRWQYVESISECNATYLRAPDDEYCLALIPQKGLYLPGWYRADLFRYITLDATPAWCRSGYLLEIASNCSVVWYQSEQSWVGHGRTAHPCTSWQILLVGNGMWVITTQMYKCRSFFTTGICIIDQIWKFSFWIENRKPISCS